MAPQYAGNEIWWNGGDDSGKIGGYGFYGAYLSTTSTLPQEPERRRANSAPPSTASSPATGAAAPGITSTPRTSTTRASTSGPASRSATRRSTTLTSQYNALGYSGTNSGGRLLIENSEFDNNEDGFDTNSQNADEPAPQNGACPAGVKPPVAGAPTCWVFFHNYVHDNNNPNVPAAGSAAQGPVGTGMSVAGARNDTIMGNTFTHNNAWGVIFVPYPDAGGPCHGGTIGGLGPGSCLFDEWGLHLIGNTFGSNGGYGHPSNGDFQTDQHPERQPG